jgi:iron complex outermembrane receptor protein
MMMRVRTWHEGRLLAGVSLLFVASLPASAFAQAGSESASPVASDASGQGGLEEIVVTARKVAENLQDVPVAVTAFSGLDLANQNAQRVQDVARFTPGLIIRPGNASSTSLTIALRGQAQTDVLATLDPSVGTYVDGIYWARAYGLNGSLLDIQSVQVLKGPQGTLFGRNTTGGAMLINSNDPELGEFSGRLSATYGRFDERELVGIVNVPIGERSLSGHCSAMARVSPRPRHSPVR